MNKAEILEAQIKDIENLKEKAVNVVTSCDKALYKLKWDLLKEEDGNRE